MTSLSVQGAAITGRLFALNLSVSAGDLVAVIGPNGGGKTSLLRAIAVTEHSSGQVFIDGEPLAKSTEARRRALLAFLPATRDVLWPIPARDVIAMGANTASEDDINRVSEMLELGTLLQRPMDQLSTGERTRVMFARCLVGCPSLLLLDEPLSNLDPYWVLRFLEILEDEAKRGAMVLVALHDLALLPRFSRALLVAGGEVHMDEAPATLLGSERFEEIFRVRQGAAGWAIRR